MEWLTCIRKAIDYMEEHLEPSKAEQEEFDQAVKEYIIYNPELLK